MASETALVGGARTPFSDFGKAYREAPLVDRGAHAAQAALERAGLPASAIDQAASATSEWPLAICSAAPADRSRTRG